MNPLQGDEWLQERCGLVTASNFSKVLAGGKGKTRRAYMLKLAAERLTGEVQPTYQSKAMERGSELEDQAREEYQFVTGNHVELVGLIKRGYDLGCSLDGTIGDVGTFEAKCPEPHTHVEYVLKGKLPTTYRAQVQGQLWVTGRQWCDFVSFCPNLKGPNYLFKVRVGRDEDYIQEIRKGVYKFVAELKEIVRKVGG